jgi:protein SCO1
MDASRLRRLALPMIAFVIGLATLAITAVLTLAPTSRPAGAASVGGPFKLVDQDGRTVTDRDFIGAPHLVFFGFTRCPDVCPTKLFELSEVLRATGDKGRNLRALFVSIDPERDTPEALKTYLASFDPRIVGLTGDPDAVQATTRAYRAFARKVPLKDGDYTMDHTAIVYLMDKNGQFVAPFSLKRKPEEAAAELRRYL